MDETYIKIKGQWRYLYRAVRIAGPDHYFLLTEHQDQEAALRFLKKAIRRNGLPETITIDGSDAHEAAIESYNEAHGTAIIIRQVKYLNSIVEQDHRAVKRVTRPILGVKAFDAAQDTLSGDRADAHAQETAAGRRGESRGPHCQPKCSIPWRHNLPTDKGNCPFMTS